MYTVLSYLPTALLPHKPSFARYVKEHIFNRLQMNSTTFSFAAANATGRLVDGFVRQGINITENPLGKGTTRVAPYLFPATEEGDSRLIPPIFVGMRLIWIVMYSRFWRRRHSDFRCRCGTPSSSFSRQLSHIFRRPDGFKCFY
jgi:hypothetical protein